MICPQCKTVYDGESVFCLADGNALVDESGEQATVVSRIRMSPAVGSAPVTICGSCGLANRSNSRFCKNCGGPIAPHVSAFDASQFVPHPAAGAFAVNVDQERENTVIFHPPAMARATAAASAPAGTVGNVNNQMLLIGLLAGALIIAAAIIYAMSGDTTPANSTGNKASSTAANTIIQLPTRQMNNAAVSVSPAANIVRNGVDATADSPHGRLTTNQRLRSASHRNSEIIGVHYQNALVEILAEETYTMEDGTYATWYRVRILQDGCDLEGRMGCGNDLNGIPGQAASEGWMNAKHIRLE